MGLLDLTLMSFTYLSEQTIKWVKWEDVFGKGAGWCLTYNAVSSHHSLNYSHHDFKMLYFCSSTPVSLLYFS